MPAISDLHPNVFTSVKNFQSEKAKRRWLAGWEQKQNNMLKKGYIYIDGKWVKKKKRKRRR